MLSYNLNYFKFNSQLNKMIQKCEKSRYVYIELSDQGTARFSAAVANDFAVQVKADILSGTFESRVAPLTDNYDRWKNRFYPGQAIGHLTGRMVSSIHAWRSRMVGDKNKRGYVVGIDQTKDKPSAAKLYWLEMGVKMGVKMRSKGGVQVARPIFAHSLNRYVGMNYGRHVKAAAAHIRSIWRT